MQKSYWCNFGTGSKDLDVHSNMQIWFSHSSVKCAPLQNAWTDIWVKKHADVFTSA